MSWIKKYWSYPVIILTIIFFSQVMPRAQELPEGVKIDPSLYDGYLQRASPCGSTEKIFKYLRDIYGEEIMIVKPLESINAFISLFEDKGTKSWTILISQENIGSCVLAHDENFSLNKRGKIVYRFR
tara:strand:+ start:3901 stop:4281 length:381 start_codon:yes stop_codon:yes gene_type:complete